MYIELNSFPYILHRFHFFTHEDRVGKVKGEKISNRSS